MCSSWFELLAPVTSVKISLLLLKGDVQLAAQKPMAANQASKLGPVILLYECMYTEHLNVSMKDVFALTYGYIKKNRISWKS